MDISANVVNFLSKNSAPPNDLSKIAESGNVEGLLNCLSHYLAQPRWAKPIAYSFKPIIPELIARWPGILSPSVIVCGLGRLVGIVEAISKLAVVILKRLDLHGDVLDKLNRDSPDGVKEITQCLLAVYRLLKYDNRRFSQFITPAALVIFTRHQDRTVRYLANRIYFLYSYLSDEHFEAFVRNSLGNDPIYGWYDEQNIDFYFLLLWEKKRLEDWQLLQQATVQESEAYMTRSSSNFVVTNENLTLPVVNVFGTLLFQDNSKSKATNFRDDLVFTSTVSQNGSKLAKALSSPCPVLVTGPPGCGKTTLVNYIVSQIRPDIPVISLHMNEETDAKTLIGIHTTGKRPGTFVWQAGILTKALQDGYCVLIEDMDRIPNNILGLLTSIVRRRELRIPGREEPLIASSDFRIVATMRSESGQFKTKLKAQNKFTDFHLWVVVEFQTPELIEITEISISRFPILGKLSDQMIRVFDSVQNDGSVTSLLRPKVRVSPRDYLKWCARTDAALRDAGHTHVVDSLTENILDGIYLDALDCFVGSLTGSSEERTRISSVVAKGLCLAPERQNFLEKLRSPVIERATGTKLKFGRCELAITNRNSRYVRHPPQNNFSLNRFTRKVVEKVSVAIRGREPLLLIGETGIGKTSAIQHLAKLLGQKLVVINLSQQSESGDILGGFKPVTIKAFVLPLKEEFDDLFMETFSSDRNRQFSEKLVRLIAKSRWKELVKFWREALQAARKAFTEQSAADTQTRTSKYGSKRRKIETDIRNTLPIRWSEFAKKLDAFEQQLNSSSEAFAFSFVEGEVVKAVRSGAWVLLDEINLATTDTLESLLDLLDSGPGMWPSLQLTEAGASERIQAHPEFRIFAAMNPSTDVGKRELPLGIRSRFTEIYVDSPEQDPQSLCEIALTYLFDASPSPAERDICKRITELYLSIQERALQGDLIDGSGQRPQFSLRSFTRALSYAKSISMYCSMYRALYEGFSMCFATCLGRTSEPSLETMLQANIFQDPLLTRKELRKPIRWLSNVRDVIQVEIDIVDHTDSKSKHKSISEMYYLPKGGLPIQAADDYIVTQYIARSLRNLIRALSAGRFPVLIQGPTSAGKTSMIDYLARRSGNDLVRINNHEHTDLQEYIGSYVSTSTGQLAFQEGVLVQALRNGSWVVLDELNLAPSDVLEALNRLLDENRELMIPETQEVVRPHPNFMLFATQNPAGAYGGRKMLSRAFRGRFLELHFEDIPLEELNVILTKRSLLPATWSRQILEVYSTIPRLRQQSRLFDEITLRDLFRWAFRQPESIEDLACHGFMLLAEKVRSDQERQFIQETIERVMSRKGVKIRVDDNRIYKNITESSALIDQSGLVWTRSMRRLFALVHAALNQNEPVLLVGETGCGKTRVCQVLADLANRSLITVNAHQNLETSDLIGAQRPTRRREKLQLGLLEDLRTALNYVGLHFPDSDVTLQYLADQYDAALNEKRSLIPNQLHRQITANRGQLATLFEWQNGPLVTAMQSGALFLLDEISLADDSVLERVNSVLDPQRSILLAEKGTVDSTYTAMNGFQFLATMNPAGDYGKKELSTALRNRFTEIWVPPLRDAEDAIEIVRAKLNAAATHFAEPLVQFGQWFTSNYRSAKLGSVSVRDLLTCVEFINTMSESSAEAVLQSMLLVFVDTLGADPSGTIAVVANVDYEREKCLAKLQSIFKIDFGTNLLDTPQMTNSPEHFGFSTFTVPKRYENAEHSDFDFSTPTTRINAMRILRALQIPKPVLIEGDPGVGKTSLVSAIATMAGYGFYRLNLSEQTDLMDLFGSDVPVEHGGIGSFAWKDAPFLTAMKNGQWVLLDEMNLASQSILEGLNACIDHRGEVFIPELGKTFTRHPQFRLFAAQNPHFTGSGRKGLPTSFINRFSIVFADAFSAQDMIVIASQSYPSIDIAIVQQVVGLVLEFSSRTQNSLDFTSHGRPWEFNLRDTLRFLQLLSSERDLLPSLSIHDVADILFCQRFRDPGDCSSALFLIQKHFGLRICPRQLSYNLTPDHFQVGSVLLLRQSAVMRTDMKTFELPKTRLPVFQSVMAGVSMRWPILVTGSSDSGKTAMINSLASVLGQNLLVVSMSADMDTGDLIGAYDQPDVLQNIRRLYDELLVVTKNCLKFVLNSEPLNALAIDLANLVYLIVTESDGENCFKEICRSVEQILEAFQGLDHAHLESSQRDMRQIHQEMTSMALSGRSIEAGFRWIEGPLTTAVQKGHWLLLENANFSSPAVLDRLNSLLEPKGTLIINEHCDDDGQPKFLTPHDSFRIFLTMDPKRGEISRAMRNRCIELFVSSAVKDSPSLSLPLLSTNWRFDMFRHFLRSSDIAQIAPELLLQRLSFADLMTLRRFLGQCKTGLMERTELKNIEAINNTTSVLLGGQILQVCIEFYKSAVASTQLNSSDLEAQPVHPLHNEAIFFRRDHLNPESESKFIVWLIDIYFEVSKMKVLLAASGPLLKSTVQHRPGSRIDLTNSTYEFLRRVLRCFLDWIPSVLDLARFDQNKCSAFRDLANMWWHILDLLREGWFTDRKLAPFMVLAHEYSSSTSNASSLDKPLFEAFLIEICRLNKFSIDRLIFMEGLWYLFRGNLLCSEVQIKNMEQFHSIANQFDALVLKSFSSVADLSKIHLVLISVARAANPQEAELLKVQGLLNEGSPSRSKLDDDKSDSPHFQQLFEQFIRLRDLVVATQFQAVNPDSVLWTSANIMARRPLFQSLNLRTDNSLHGCLNALISFTTSDFNMSDGLDIVYSMNKTFMEKTASMYQVSIEQIRTLREENDVLKDVIAKEASKMNFDVHGMVEKLSTFLVLSVLKENIAMLDEASAARVQSLPSTFNSNVEISHLRPLHPPMANTSAPEEFQRATSLCFSRSLKTSEESEDSARLLEDRLIGFGLGCLLLYVPDKAYDPASKNVIQRQLHENTVDSLSTRLDYLSEMQMQVTGQSENLQTRIVSQELKDLGSRQLVESVARPRNYSIDDLHDEFDNLTRFRKKLLSVFSQNSINQRQRQDFVMDCERIVERLRLVHIGYQDIVKPIIGFLQSIKLGLVFGRQETTQLTKQQASTIRGVRGLNLKTIMNQLFNKSEDIQRTQSRSVEHAYEQLKEIGLFNQACGLLFDSIGFHGEKMKLVLDELYAQWKRIFTETQKKVSESSSIFHYREDNDSTVENEEDEIVDLFLSSTKSSRSQRSGKALVQDLSAHTCSLCFSVFDVSIPIPKRLKVMLVKDCSTKSPQGVFSQLQDKERDENSQPMILTMIDFEDKRRSVQSLSPLEQQYNFYTDMNAGECERLRNVIISVKDRFARISEAWPEHAVPHTALNICRDILGQSLIEPIAKLLGKIEQLYSVVEEWSKVASREYNVQQNREALRDLIIAWRRLELSTWARLLEIEDEKCEEDARSWWFIAYENIVVNLESLNTESEESLNQHTFNLISTLEELLRNSTIGQFSTRLKIVDTLRKCIKLFSTREGALFCHVDALGNLTRHYSRYVSRVDQAIEAARVKIGAAITDTIKLASWKDTNILALRESARASHRKLLRSVRKYRKFLQQPSSSLIRDSIPPPVTATNLSQRPFEAKGEGLNLTTGSITPLQLDSWPSRYRNPAETVRTMQKISYQWIPYGETAAERLTEFVASLKTSVTQLKTATPSILTEENQTQIKHLTSRKQRLLANVLKDLRQAGLKPNLPTTTFNSQNSTAKLLSQLSFLNHPDYADIVGNIHSAIDNISKASVLARNHSPYLNRQDVDRSYSMLHSMLAQVIQQHSDLSQFSVLTGRLQNILTRVQNAYNQRATCKPLTGVRQYQLYQCKALAAFVPAFTENSIHMLECQSRLGNLDFAQILASLREYATWFQEKHEELVVQPLLPTTLVIDEQDQFYHRIFEKYRAFRSEVERWISKVAVAKPALLQLLSWIGLDHAEDSPASSENYNHSGLDLNTHMYQILDQILGSVQDVNQLKERFKPEENNWLKASGAHTLACLRSLRCERIVHCFEAIVSTPFQYRYQENNEALSEALELLGFALPIVKEYADILKCQLMLLSTLQLSTSKALYEFSGLFCQITEHGFCKPAENSQNQNQDMEKAESGTGLGEGEGAADISKDVQSDEDVSELAGEGENPDAEASVEKATDAISVDEELTGANDDADDGQRADGEEGSESRKVDDQDETNAVDATKGPNEGLGEGLENVDEDLDDTTGQVDDLDPSAVDEKFWDEAADKENRDTQSQKTSNNQGKEEQAAGNDKQQGEEANLDESKGEGESASEVESPHEDEVGGKAAPSSFCVVLDCAERRILGSGTNARCPTRSLCSG